MNEEELKEEIEEIREEQKILCRRYSSEEEDDNLIMKDQRRLDKGYNKRINQILKERSSWYNIALEVDEILIILLKARLEGFQKGKQEAQKMFLEEIDRRLNSIKYRIRTGFGTKEDYIGEIETLQELKSKIGEEK